jgi:hypothetical protein
MDIFFVSIGTIQHVSILASRDPFFRAKRDERRTTPYYIYTWMLEYHSNSAMEGKWGLLNRYNRPGATTL